MSEREPSPEQPKPLYDNCNGCNQDYYLTSDNAVVFNHARQPECNFIYCACPKCNFRTRIFIGTETVEQARALGIHVEDEEWASDHVYDEWCDLKGIVLPEVTELTDRQEKLVRHLGATINNMLATAPDLFWDIMNDPHNDRPYPNRWR